jgi:hypothetical protein
VYFAHIVRETGGVALLGENSTRKLNGSMFVEAMIPLSPLFWSCPTDLAPPAQSARYRIQVIDIPVWISAAAIWNLDPSAGPPALKNSNTVWCIA